jgi:hypothetical protein
METAKESESRQDLAEVDPLARPRLGSDEFRSSLEAVRSAQTAARSRLQRETRWARVIAASALMAVGVTAWAAAHRPPRAGAVATGPSVAAAATPSVATPKAATSIAPSPREAPPAARPAPSEAIAPTERSGAAVGPSGGQVALCDAAFEQRNWTAIASTCAAAFGARPRESALAMRVAQAQHRRGHIATAADWARKALALDADIPEAFVIVARAEVGAGHARAAADAYGRYLTLAPRGWHAAEARRALGVER